jgi:hypothetical protein
MQKKYPVIENIKVENDIGHSFVKMILFNSSY